MTLQTSNALDQLLQKVVKDFPTAGLGVAIAQGEKSCFHAAGWADVEEKRRIEENAIFDIASIGKLFTVASAFILIEEGHFELNTPIASLMDVPKVWREVQIRHLLSHSSGIKNYTDTRDYWKEIQLDVSKERIIEYVIHLPLEFEPGTAFRYNNTGFYLLGLLIEQMSGLGYFDFVRRHVLEKHDIFGIMPTNNRIHLPGMVKGYCYGENRFTKVDYYSASGTYSAGGFSATLPAFLKFEKLLFDGKIIAEEHVKLLSKAFVQPDGNFLEVSGPDIHFRLGHGLFLLGDEKQETVGHAGSIQGFSSSYKRYMQDDLAVIVSVNTENVPIQDLPDEVYERYMCSPNAMSKHQEK